MTVSENYHFFYKSKLSQWHMVDFKVDGIIYCCCEQFMMSQKSLLMGDIDSHYNIMKSRSPAEHQRFGREVKYFNNDLWDKNKINIVHKGNYHRFTQSDECLKLLLDTFPKLLVEASPIDRVYGVGLSANDPLINDSKNWKGVNLLGQILTLVRTEISLGIEPIFPGFIK